MPVNLTKTGSTLCVHVVLKQDTFAYCIFSMPSLYSLLSIDLLNKAEIVLPTAASLSDSNKLYLLFCGDLLIDNKKGLPKFYLLHREIFFS